MLVLRRFLAFVLGVSALCVVMLGVTADAFAQTSPLADVWNFSGGGDGGAPYSGLIQASDGDFYGTTSRGGAFAAGTAYKVTAGGVRATLHVRQRIDGAYPGAGIEAGGNFYGTTSLGGVADQAPSSVDPSGTVTTLHSFIGGRRDQPDGAPDSRHGRQFLRGGVYGRPVRSRHHLQDQPKRSVYDAASLCR
jgi:uncharacterized repeat protein (TIGR03803 family)